MSKNKNHFVNLKIQELLQEANRLKSAKPLYDIVQNCGVDSQDDYATAIGLLRESYSLGIAPLQPTVLDESGLRPRPLTVQESAKAFIESWESSSNSVRMDLLFPERKSPPHEFYTDFDSGASSVLRYDLSTCTGAIFDGKGYLKIIPMAEELVMMGVLRCKEYIKSDYSKKDFPELSVNKSRFNQGLRKGESLNHEVWVTAIPDKNIRKALDDIMFSIVGEDNKAMEVKLPNVQTNGALYQLAFNSFDRSLECRALNYTTNFISVGIQK